MFLQLTSALCLNLPDHAYASHMLSVNGMRYSLTPAALYPCGWLSWSGWMVPVIVMINKYTPCSSFGSRDSHKILACAVNFYDSLLLMIKGSHSHELSICRGRWAIAISKAKRVSRGQLVCPSWFSAISLSLNAFCFDMSKQVSIPGSQHPTFQ